MTEIIKIDGMTCDGCATRIEGALGELSGVIMVKVSLNKSLAEVTYNPSICSVEDILNIIEGQGYTPSIETYPQERSSQKEESKKYSISQIIAVGIIIFAIYLIIKNTIGLNYMPKVDETVTLGLLFVIGLFTSLHCIAMCGGINLSQCIIDDKYSNEPTIEKIRPALLYNTGRIISYTVVGGLVGALGSILNFSNTTKSVITIFAGVLMLIMGLNMLNILPWLKVLNIRIPSKLVQRFQGKKKNNRPFYVGLLNGLMPCGPLQSMQIYALGTGSIALGAASMFMFSLGTVPLMLGLGVTGSFLSNKFTKSMFRISAVLVVVLGIIMIDRGFNLSGTSLLPARSANSGVIATLEEGKQVIKTIVDDEGYTPKVLVVQKDIPVKWVIEARSLNGCNNPITVPALRLQKDLSKGDNVIEFTPKDEGNILYTCWMGMIEANILVVPDINNVSQELLNNNSIGPNSCCSSIK